MRSVTPPPYLTRLLGLLTLIGCLLAPAGARAAGQFYIRGGGNGHGIGMSQYGADGYAQHGAEYRAILAHYYQGTAVGQSAPGCTVRVLLADGPSTSFSGATAAGRQRLAASITYIVSATPGGRLQLSGGAGASAAPLTITGPGPLRVAGQGTYRGSLQLSADGHGGVLTVDVVELDDYVRGVISAEMPASWPTAALEAQAVAARTYAITTGVGSSAYDVYDDTRSQMYAGVSAETPATDAAVAATRGQIVTYGGRAAVTYFFASSGGYTESIQNVWPSATPEPWLTGVPDPYDSAGGDPYHAWGSQMSLAAATTKLGALVHGTLVGVVATSHGLSPRILTARVVGTRGSTNVTGTQLQDAFGLATTYAAFTTISTSAAHGALTGSVYPARAAGGSVTVQQLGPGGWTTIGHAPLAAGAFTWPAAIGGRYRITYRSLGGPAVNQP